MISIKDYLYLAAIAVLVIGFFAYRHSLIVEGEQICLAREKSATEKQAVADAKINQDTIDALNSEISRLSHPPPAGVPDTPVRVQCYTRKVSAPAGVPGALGTHEPATPGAVIPEVSRGVGEGRDLGPSLQRLALAADLVSARDRACLKELKEP